MDIKKMTNEELITLKKGVTEELNTRLKNDYYSLEESIINLIKDFEDRTGYYVAVDNGDFNDRATNFIQGCFYYTSEYIEPFE